MAWQTETDPVALLEKANGKHPMTIAEIHRLATASGEEVPKYSRFKQIAADADERFLALLLEQLADAGPVRGPVVRRRRRGVPL